MIRVISSFADGPVNFHSTGPAEDQIQKLISSTGLCYFIIHTYFISSIFSSGKLCIFNSLLCVTGNQIHSALLNYLLKCDINLSKYFCYWMIDPNHLITKILDEGDNH